MAHRQGMFLTICLLMVVCIASFATAVTTFTAQETEVLTLSVDSIDLDGDHVAYTFSEPFDQNGSWLTDYDSAGEYIVNITASDGVETVVEYVRVIVEETNRAPFLSTNSLTFSEQEEINLADFLEDPDQDVLIYSFSEPFDEEGNWIPSFNDAGRYVIEVEMTDGQFTISRLIEVLIEETNQAPVFAELFSEESEITVAEGETLEFWAVAVDGDLNDKLTYTWSFDGLGDAQGQSGNLAFNYFAEGEYSFSVIATDGEFEITREWTILVENTNRAPEFESEEFIFSAAEGQTITLQLPEKDQDGDMLTYEFETPFDASGTWHVDYESAGVHEVEVTATDGDLETEFVVQIDVAATDRAPVLNYELERMYYAEGEEFSVELTAEDFDGDNSVVTILSAPVGLSLDESNANQGIYVLEWDISYDTIQRSVNPITNMLNALRLERPLLQAKSEQISIETCAAENCVYDTIDLVIEDTNRAPIFLEFYDQSAVELDVVEPYVLAIDLDGDILKYYFSDPLGASGTWQTGYEDAGKYTATITASDGYLTTSESIVIDIDKLNREPTLWTNKNSYTVLEGQEVSFVVEANDEDPEDELILELIKGPVDASLSEQVFSWVPSFDTVQPDASQPKGLWAKIVSGSELFTKLFSHDEVVMQLEFAVTDQIVEVVLPIELVVKDVNRAPVLVSTTPHDLQTAVNAGVEMGFAVDVHDLDSDVLQYTWSFSGFDYERVSGTSEISRTFTSPGEKRVTVEVTDGIESIEHSWIIDVTGSVDRASTSDSSDSGASTSSVIIRDSESDNKPSYAVYTVEDWK